MRLLALFVAVALVVMPAVPAQAQHDADATARLGSAPAAHGSVARGCTDWRSAVAVPGRWTTSTSDCAVFGSKGWRVGYAWAVAPTSESRICVQGLGFRWSKAQKKRVAKWYGLGCGVNNSYCTDYENCTVPWGNVAATPKVRAKSQAGFLGAGYRWRH